MTPKQKTVLVWLGSLALVSVLVVAIILAWVLVALKTGVTNVSEHIDRDLIVIGAAATKWEKASDAQSKYVTDSAKKTTEVLDAAKDTVQNLDKAAVSTQTLVANTDKILNDPTTGLLVSTGENVSAVLQQTTDFVGHTDNDLNNPQDGFIPALQTDLGRLSQKLDNLIESATLLTSHTNDRVIGPETQDLLLALRGSAENIKASTDDLREKVHQATRPASFLYRVGQGLFSSAVKSAEFYGAVR